MKTDLLLSSSSSSPLFKVLGRSRAAQGQGRRRWEDVCFLVSTFHFPCHVFLMCSCCLALFPSVSIIFVLFIFLVYSVYVKFFFRKKLRKLRKEAPTQPDLPMTRPDETRCGRHRARVSMPRMLLCGARVRSNLACDFLGLCRCTYDNILQVIISWMALGQVFRNLHFSFFVLFNCICFSILFHKLLLSCLIFLLFFLKNVTFWIFAMTIYNKRSTAQGGGKKNRVKRETQEVNKN